MTRVHKHTALRGSGSGDGTSPRSLVPWSRDKQSEGREGGRKPEYMWSDEEAEGSGSAARSRCAARARAHRGHLPGQARFMCMRSKGRIIADCTWILNCWSILKFCSIFTNLQLVLHLLTINFTKFHDYSHFNTLIKKLTMFGIFKFPTVFLDSHEIHQIIPFLLKISRFSNVFAAKLPDFCKIYFWIFAENRRL